MEGQDIRSLLEILFDRYDRNHDNVLDINEFVKLLVHIQKKTDSPIKDMTIEAAKAVFNLLISIHKKNNSVLSFEEFVEWWLRDDKYEILVGKKSKKIIKAYKIFKEFSYIHTNENGIREVMSPREFYEMNNAFDDTITYEASEQVFDSIDNDGNGLITFKEFLDWLEWM